MRASPEQADVAYREAMHVCGRWLAARARTEGELRDRLEGRGFDPATIEAALGRLKELGLVDDISLARRVIEEKVARRTLGPEAIRAHLEARGIEGEVAGAAVAEVLGDESARAREAALALVGRVARYPLREQGNRLARLLGARGFSEEAAMEGARAALPPEGWD